MPALILVFAAILIWWLIPFAMALFAIAMLTVLVIDIGKLVCG